MKGRISYLGGVLPGRARGSTNPRSGFIRTWVATFGFAVLLLTALGSPALAEHYAAIWERVSGPAWVARHGMTSDGYQQEFDRLIAQGYRLKLVSGYSVDGQDRYTAIWERVSGPAWVARHGMTSDGYQQEFDRLIAQGYRLKLVSGYSVDGQDRYAAIWEKVSGPAWVARHGMTSDGYQQEFDRLIAQGYRLKLVSGYSVGEEDRYAAIWERASGPAWVARHGMTSDGYQQEFDRLIAQGYRLKLVSGYSVDGQDRYAAIWEKVSGPAWVARHGMTSEGYQQEFDRLVAQGYRLKLVSGN